MGKRATPCAQSDARILAPETKDLLPIGSMKLSASIRDYVEVFWRLISKILLTPFGPSLSAVSVRLSSRRSLNKFVMELINRRTKG